MDFKIHIAFPFDAHGGGGNFFLRNLKDKFIRRGVYEKNVFRADCVLFNSHHSLQEIYKLKNKFPSKLFIHRIDGPIFDVRGKQRYIDRQIYKTNHLVADGTIFQSVFSQQANRHRGIKRNNFEMVAINAPADKEKKNNNFVLHDKIKLINTSNSANWRKGFDVYQYLDDHLDFNKYEMTFIGTSPVTFKNIKNLGKMDHNELIECVRQHDIFITASRKDPCSNSLIEALHLGLPAVVLNDGGHPEIIGNGGETFQGTEDVIAKIEKVAGHYSIYKKNISLPNMNDTESKYYHFIESILSDKNYTPKKLGDTTYHWLKLLYASPAQKVRKLLSIINNE